MRGRRDIVGWVLVIGLGAGLPGLVARAADSGPPPERGAMAGSASCRECHPAFHERWEHSRHGASVTSVDRAWAEANLAPLPAVVRQGGEEYRLQIAGEGLAVAFAGKETGQGDVPVGFALGGRDLWYFLGAWEAGRLQVLPVAFDRHRRAWFNPAASGVRPHAGETAATVDWTSPAYTFNTACYTCHVSGQGGANPGSTDAAKRWWDEPGIRCESCHGPGADHVEVCRAAGPGEIPQDLRIIAASRFTRDQVDGLCGSCHSRHVPLTPQFRPGDALADHFDLALWEGLEFFADGRERGETYTMTSWLANRCAREGNLDCLHCHTSSGRDRFAGEAANQACLPCHATEVADVERHSHHAAENPGGRCVDCHMPVNEFARMRRHDHSLRPPTPATTLLLGSSNACTDCHSDRDAVWADARVREWQVEDYQAPVVRRARWIERARGGDWTQLDAMLASLREEEQEPVYVASMIRLLAACEDDRTVPVLVEGLGHPSPWVKAAAAASLEGRLSAAAVRGLADLTGHSLRLVRLRAAQALAPLPSGVLETGEQARLDRALDEHEGMLRSRTEDPGAWEALGHLRLDRGDAAAAVGWFERALARDPENLRLLISLGTAHYRSGQTERAEARFRRATEVHADRAMAWSNWVRFLELNRQGEASARARAEAMRSLRGVERDRFIAGLAGR